MKKSLIGIVSLFVFTLIIYTQTTLFIVPPIGAVPEGKTVVMLRLTKLNFIDSADAICAREMGSVNLMCRGMMLGAILSKATVIVKLPYSKVLDTISTNGKEYRQRKNQ